MALNYIFVGFFLIAFLSAIYKFFVIGDAEIFTTMMNSIFDMSSTAFEIAIGITGLLAFWLGIMNVGEKGGVVKALAKIVGPFFNKLFP